MKSRVSIGSIHVLQYMNARDCVDELSVHTRVLTGSEHMKSHISTGSIHVFPYMNSRDSVDKLSVQTSVLTS